MDTRVVGEHSGRRRRRAARLAGASGNENVGMSNDNGCITTRTENPRVPGRRHSSRGEPGAKPNPKGEGDAEAVNIPPPVAQDRR